MTDFNEVILFAALMTYLFNNANDWVLSAVLLFVVVVIATGIYSAAKKAWRISRLMNAAHKREGDSDSKGEDSAKAPDRASDAKDMSAAGIFAAMNSLTQEEIDAHIGDFAKRHGLSICLDDDDSTVVEDHSKGASDADKASDAKEGDDT